MRQKTQEMMVPRHVKRTLVGTAIATMILTWIPWNGKGFTAVAATVSAPPVVGGKVVVSTPAQLEYIDSNQNNYLQSNIQLANDIDVTGFSWVPIGSSGNPYTGTFDGAGHEVTGVNQNTTAQWAGFFGFTNNATVENLGVNVTIVDSSTSNPETGGLIGYMQGGTISNSYAKGSVTVPNYNAGGLVGNQQGGSISNSHADVAVSSNPNSTGASGGVGGLVGEQQGNITNSYATGAVFGAGSLGGFVGSTIGGQFTNCYATGSVTADGPKLTVNYAGGLLGYVDMGVGVTDCYATGKVTLAGGSDWVGGFAGAAPMGLFATDSYFDTTTTQRTSAQVYGGISGVTGLSDTDMKLQKNYSNWDFTNAWGISSSINNGYPYLRATLPKAATPTITAQPQDLTVSLGDTNQQLSVSASVSDGGTLSYQWYSNTSNSTTGGTLIDGATSASYSPTTTHSGITYYYVVVTNTNNTVNGNTTANVTSSIVTVSVSVPNAASLNTIPTATPGGKSGTTTVTATPNHAGDTLVYEASNGSITTPTSGSVAPTGKTVYSGGTDIPVTQGDYIGIYEINSSNQVVAFAQVGPLQDSQIASFSFNVSSSNVKTGGTVTVTGSVYSGAGATSAPLVNWPVSLNDNGFGSWNANGQTTTDAVYSAHTDNNGTFTLEWGAPSVSGVYGLSVTSKGQTKTQYVNVQKVLTQPVDVKEIGSSADQITKEVSSSNNPATKWTATVSIPANTFMSTTPVYINTSASSHVVNISGKRAVAAIGVNFPGTPKHPITITIQNSDIGPGATVYKILPDGSYQELKTGISIMPGKATITFQNDPSFVVMQPNGGGGGGPVPPTIIQAFFTEQPQVGKIYSATVHEIGGLAPMKWTVTKGTLPPGLRLGDNGLISGTPTTAGTYTFTVQVEDANHLSSSKQLTVTVQDTTAAAGASGGSTSATTTGGGTNTTSPVTPLSMVAPKKHALTLGQSVNIALQATGGQAPYTWSVVGALPTGLALNSTTGVLSGTLSTPGVHKITLNVKDAIGATVQQSIWLNALHPYQREILWNGEVKNVPAVVQKDGTTETTYMPIWYVMQFLKPMGISSTWNGKQWHMLTSNRPDLSNVQASKGNTGIYLNGTLVQNVNTVAKADPSTHKSTTYMPVWYVMQLMKRLGLQSTWDGTTWTVTK